MGLGFRNSHSIDFHKFNFPNFNQYSPTYGVFDQHECRNPNLGLATKARTCKG